MIRVLSLCLCACALALPACAKDPASTTNETPDEKFQTMLGYLKQDIATMGVPGAAIAIVANGQLQASAGVGVEQLGGTVAVQPTTLFRVASLSKMVLAATAMTLVEEGRLVVTDPVTHYIPLTLLPGYDPTTIPVETLLDHTSGIPDLTKNTCPVGPGQLAAYLNANPKPLWSPPGQVYDYSNRGFSVLGWMLESISGQAYEDLVAARIFGPAGMTTATYDVNAALAADHAVGFESGQQYDLDAYDCAAQHPPAGIIASVRDYAQFAAMLLGNGGSTLQPSSVSAMEQPRVDTDTAPDGAQGYGYGLSMFAGTNAKMVYHNGSLPGFRSAIWMFPAQAFAVVVFYNSGDADPGLAARQAAQLYLGDAITDGPTGVPPTAKWGQYAGTYVDPLELGTINVTFDGQKLTASNVAGPSGLTFATGIALMPSGGDEFEALLDDGSRLDLTFYPSATERSHWLVTRRGVAVRQ